MENKVKRGFLNHLFSTDHRDIGTNYLGFAILAGLIGAVFSILLRLGLDETGLHYFSRLSTYFYGNSDNRLLLSLLSTGHALIMIFFMMVPALIGGFANWMVPLLIGCDDVAFPKLNRLAFWLLVPALFLFILPIFYQPPLNYFIAVAALHLCAFSLILTFINFIVTIVTMRTPGMTFVKMPIFVWSVLIASFLGLMCFPVMLAATITPSFLAHYTNHLPIMLWFLTHPECYVLLLPAFGIVSQIISTFTQRPLVAAHGVVAAMVVIGFISFVLWTESLFQASNSYSIVNYFTIALPLMSLPVSFILFSWVATLFTGTLDLKTPVLWAIGFVIISAFGVISTIGLIFSNYRLLNETTPIFVSHFHYIVSLSVVFAIFSGWYFWFPKMTGLIVREATGRVHFILMFCAVNMIFLPQYLGHSTPQGGVLSAFVHFINWNVVSVAGAWGAAFSLLVFLYGIAESFIRRKAAGMNPWGKGAKTLEWQLPSPPPHHAWQKLPHIS